MKRILASIAALAAGFLIGCAALQQALPTPEAQVTAGGQACDAATSTTTRLLAERKITVVQAKSYRNMLVAACESMRDAKDDLASCRTRTGTDSKATPDPCWAGIADVVRIAATNITDIQKVLTSK